MSTPLLTQVRPAYFGADCGMAYIMRLSDGRFVIIDGNIGEHDEPEHLYSLLSEQNESGGEPTVAAWFITHPHGDHFGGFTRFCELYSSRVRIEKVLYHFPVPGVFDSEGSDVSEFLRVLGGLDTEIVTPHTGDVFTFADARFEVLFTCEDLYPGPVKNINNSSIVMMMELGNYKVLWLGDLQREGADCLCSQTDKKKLKCDIMQVGHHGYGGGSDELHRAADPEILLWPCPDFWFHPVRLWECNDFLIHSENIRATFVAGQKEYVFDLTAPIEYIDPYTKSTVCPDLSKESLVALEWSCMTGGKTGYAPAELSFEGGKCRLTAGDARSLCHMIHRGQTQKAEKYVFELEGTLNAPAELFGIIFDHPTPMTWSDSAPLPLSPEVGRKFSYRLEVDRSSGTAELYEGEELIARKAPLCGEPCDIILVMQNASVTLECVRYSS